MENTTPAAVASAEPVIRLEAVDKVYRLYAHPRDRMKEALHPLRKKYHTDFYALRGIDLEIRRGESVGIVGRNGSGKSTLLKTICGVLTPTAGTCAARGRISALLELGAGFNPDFTGLENIHFQCSIMGFQRGEIEAMVPVILEFADIGGFANQPVKTYSSGMFVRLAFAIAISVDPEILIVDEALAVGDAYFQAKCYARIDEMKKRGVTVLLVTHAAEAVLRHCTRALLLDGGRMLADGEPKDVVNRYLDLVFGTHEGGASPGPVPESGKNPPPAAGAGLFHTRPGYNKNEYVWGDGTVRIEDFLITNAAGSAYPPELDAAETVTITVRARFLDDVPDPLFGLLIKTVDGVYVHGTNSLIEQGPAASSARHAGDLVEFTFRLVPALVAGHYLLSFGVSADGGLVPLGRRYDSVLVAVRNPRPVTGLVDLRAWFEERVAPDA